MSSVRRFANKGSPIPSPSVSRERVKGGREKFKLREQAKDVRLETAKRG